MIKHKVIGAAILAFFCTVTLAAAQTPVRVRGTIESIELPILNVKARDGTMVKVKVADVARVLTVDKKSVADVKPGTFVGITAMPLPDGTQKVVEVHIFPEAMRGTGEGHRPWDLMPNSTMTNANIETAVASADGQELVLKYKDGEKKFIMPPNVEVVMFAPSAVSELAPGKKIFVVAGKKLDDGTIEAPSMVISHNGVDPPM